MKFYKEISKKQVFHYVFKAFLASATSCNTRKSIIELNNCKYLVSFDNFSGTIFKLICNLQYVY